MTLLIVAFTWALLFGGNSASAAEIRALHSLGFDCGHQVRQNRPLAIPRRDFIVDPLGAIEQLLS
jgi:hypothetical protein